MKRPLLLLFTLLVTIQLRAQQEAQFTQFMFNKLTLNPAYAGSAGVPTISALNRSQWIGLEGAPVSQLINFHLPILDNRVGIGLSLIHDKIGPVNSWSYQFKYSYRVKVGNGNVGLGLQGALKSYRVNWQETFAFHSGDQQLQDNPSGKILPNFGVGLYYQNPKFYLGVSLPNMLKGDLTLYEANNQSDHFSQEEHHYYFMGGIMIKVARNVMLKPAVLARMTFQTPSSVDLNAMFVFYEKLWMGASYRLGGNLKSRTGESMDAIIQYQLSNSLRAGLSYDFTLSKVRNYSSGTFEIMLDYAIHKKGQAMTNPRFF